MSGPAQATPGFVLLRAESLRLLLPGADVGAAEYIEDAPVPTAAPGLFEYRGAGGSHTVAALSAALRPLERFPDGRFVLTPLRADDAAPRFAWDEVRVLIDACLEPLPLPPALRTHDGPIEGYVVHQGEILLCTTAQRLLAYAVGVGVGHDGT